MQRLNHPFTMERNVRLTSWFVRVISYFGSPASTGDS